MSFLHMVVRIVMYFTATKARVMVFPEWIMCEENKKNEAYLSP